VEASYADTFDPPPRGQEYHHHPQDLQHHLQQQEHHHHQHLDHHDHSIGMNRHVMNCNDMDPLQIAAEAAALQANGVDDGYPPPSPFHPDHHGGLTDDDDDV
jgi:hypothetical protein